VHVCSGKLAATILAINAELNDAPVQLVPSATAEMLPVLVEGVQVEDRSTDVEL